MAATGALGERMREGLGTGLKLRMVLIEKDKMWNIHHPYYTQSDYLHAWRRSLRILLCPLMRIPQSLGRASLNRIKLN